MEERLGFQMKKPGFKKFGTPFQVELLLASVLLHYCPLRGKLQPLL